MDKKWFEDQLHNIEVPYNEVSHAINKGMDLGRKDRQIKKKFRFKTPVILSSTAVIILALGFIFPPVTAVFAKVPILGSIYQNFNLDKGKELEKNGMVTELNKSTIDNGVNVTLTSAYFDGNVIGITFKVKGKNLSVDNLGEDRPNSPVSDFNYYLFDGTEQKQWSGTMEQLRKTNNGSFIGALELQYPFKQLPDDYILPLTFNFVAGKKGTWKFEVPVNQLPYKKVTVNTKSSTKDNKYKIIMKDVILGQATTMIEFKTVRPKVGKNDIFSIAKVIDDKGHRIGTSGGGPISSKPFVKDDTIVGIQKEERWNFGKIDKNAKYLMIYPTLSRDEFDTIKPIGSTPFVVESKRFGFKIEVNKIVKEDQQFIIDYFVRNVDASHFNKDIFNNFADQITLIKSSDVIEGADGQTQFEALKKDSLIYGKNGKAINYNNLHFQSSFKVKDAQSFNFNNYSLMVPFGIFSMNDEIKMPPLKVELK